MQTLNLNQFAQEVHQNAVNHGWWEEERSRASVRALMHCEISEAVESARNHEPDHWHLCPFTHGSCEMQTVHEHPFGPRCDSCGPEMRKPEGVAVELIDFCIRALDYLAHEEWLFQPSHDTPDKLIRFSLEDYDDEDCEDVTSLSAADLADVLHALVSLDRIIRDKMAIVDAIGITFAWVQARGLDPVELMLEKHAYNKTRPYKHGGKVF